MEEHPLGTNPPDDVPPEVTRLMRRFHSRDTRPELRVRRALHHVGLRFRLHRPVPGANRRTIDICFPRERVAVFVDGCYWHACPEHGKTPARNSEWWIQKMKRTQARDLETNSLLREQGWTVLRFWEHEPTIIVANSVLAAVREARTRLAADN